MPKVEVVLTQNVVGLGSESDQVKVAAGYARNYLLPYRLAIPVTAVNKRRMEALKQRRAEREAHELNTMMELSKALSKVTLLIKVKTGEGDKIYGSVTAGTISDELKHQMDVTLDKRKIHLEKTIRTLGQYEVPLHLHADVSTTLKVTVESNAPKSTPEEIAAIAAKEAAAKADERPARRERPERKAQAPKAS